MIDFNEEDDPLDSLEDLFDDLSIDEPTGDQLYQMYGVFLRDFVNNPIHIEGIQVKVNINKSKNPLCKGKMQTFEHIITRENKHKGKRDFDHQRANKLHWIKTIIIHVNDVRIKYFNQISDKNLKQHFYWFEEKGFIVIVRELGKDFLLLTAFCVDEINKSQYKKYYNTYRK